MYELARKLNPMRRPSPRLALVSARCGRCPPPSSHSPGRGAHSGGQLDATADERRRRQAGHYRIRADVTVLLADGAAGLPEYAPFDRIQFTVGTADIPRAVLEQLAPGGRLVIPMRIRGSISRSFAFERDSGTWRTVSCEMATFVPLRKGTRADVCTIVPLAGEGNVRLETFSEQHVDRQALRTVLDQPSWRPPSC